jgi:hypothetical protein
MTLREGYHHFCRCNAPMVALGGTMTYADVSWILLASNTRTVSTAAKLYLSEVAHNGDAAYFNIRHQSGVQVDRLVLYRNVLITVVHTPGRYRFQNRYRKAEPS